MAKETSVPDGQGKLSGKAVLAMLLCFFGIVIGVNVVMARYAVSTFGGVETESSYKAGLTYMSEEAAAAEQGARQWDVEVEITSGGGTSRDVMVRVLDNAGRPVSGLAATGRFSHPTDARKDVALALASAGDGRYRAAVPAPAGQWDLLIDFSQGNARLFRSKNRVQLP